MVGLRMALPGRWVAADGALERAEDDILTGGEARRVGARRESEQGGLEQKRPNHHQGNAILDPAKPPHEFC